MQLNRRNEDLSRSFLQELGYYWRLFWETNKTCLGYFR